MFLCVGVKNARSQASAVLLRSALALLVKGSTMDVYLASVEKIFSGVICNEKKIFRKQMLVGGEGWFFDSAAWSKLGSQFSQDRPGSIPRGSQGSG